MMDKKNHTTKNSKILLNKSSKTKNIEPHKIHIPENLISYNDFTKFKNNTIINQKKTSSSTIQNFNTKINRISNNDIIIKNNKISQKNKKNVKVGILNNKNNIYLNSLLTDDNQTARIKTTPNTNTNNNTSNFCIYKEQNRNINKEIIKKIEKNKNILIRNNSLLNFNKPLFIPDHNPNIKIKKPHFSPDYLLKNSCKIKTNLKNEFQIINYSNKIKNIDINNAKTRYNKYKLRYRKNSDQNCVGFLKYTQDNKKKLTKEHIDSIESSKLTINKGSYSKKYSPKNNKINSKNFNNLYNNNTLSTYQKLPQNDKIDRPKSISPSSHTNRNNLIKNFLNDESNKNLMVNYNIIDIKNNINNINNNSNHYCYNNYLLNTCSKNKIINVKHKDLPMKFVRSYLSNSDENFQKRKIINSNSSNNITNLSKKIILYNKNNQNFSSNNQNSNSQKIYNINMQKKTSLSPSQIKHQTIYLSNIHNYKNEKNIRIYNRIDNNVNNNKYNNKISNKKYNFCGKCSPSHFRSNNINNYNYSNNSNTINRNKDKDIIPNLSLLKSVTTEKKEENNKPSINLYSKVTKDNNVKNLCKCLDYNSNNNNINKNIYKQKIMCNLQITNSLNNNKYAKTENLKTYSGKTVKEFRKNENYSTLKFLKNNNDVNNFFNNTNPNLKNNNADSHFHIINQNNNYNINYNTNNNSREVDNLIQNDIGIAKNKTYKTNTLNSKNNNNLYNKDHNKSIKMIDVCTMITKTNNFMTQTTLKNSSVYSKDTIQYNQNTMPMQIYKKPSSVGKISKKDSDRLIQTKNLTKICEGISEISEGVFVKKAFSPTKNEKNLHYSKSDFFNKNYVHFSTKKINNLNKNKIAENNNKLLVKKINNVNNVSINDGLNTKNLRKSINKTIKKNYCFISKIYNYYISVPKILQCIYIKYNPNDRVIQKHLYNKNICYFSKTRINIFFNKNISIEENLYQKSMTFGDDILNELSVNYHGETSENEELKLNFSEEDFINSDKINTNTKILNNNTYNKNNYTIGKELLENSVNVEMFKRKESQTYNKKKYFNDKNLLNGLNILNKLVNKRENEDKNNNIIAGINKLSNLFDNINKNNLSDNFNISSLTENKNEILNKIIKNQFTDKLKTYKKCPIKTNEIYKSDIKNTFNDSLINDSINESISCKNSNKIDSSADINFVETKKSKLQSIKNSFDEENTNNENTKNVIKYTYEFLLSVKNNNLDLKYNLLPEDLIEHFNELLTPTKTILIFDYLSEAFITQISIKQHVNNFRNEIINLANAVTIGNFNLVFNDISNILLLNKNNDSKLFENILILIEIFFDKAINEVCYNFLYAELFSKLNLKLVNEFIDQKNAKNNKERNIKFLVNEECNKRLNQYKQIEDDKILLVKDKFIGFLKFIDELIIVELIKQQYSFHVFEQLFQKFKLINNNESAKNTYLQSCIELLNNIGKNINDKGNQKYINNLNGYINDTLGSLITDKNEISIPKYLKFKIINLIEKNKNGWVDSLYEQSTKFQNYKENLVLFNIDNDNTLTLSDDVSDITQKQNEEQKEDLNEKIFESDLLNYIKLYNNKEKNDRYNWNVINKLIDNKKMTLDEIIIFYNKLCKKLITEENMIIILNDYIKNIIEYFAKILSKKEIEVIHNEMIKYFKNINDIIGNNKFMYKIIGNLLFILIEKRFYFIKDLNVFLKEDKATHINLAIITKYCIISSGKFAKKYYNDFKQTKLFINNEIFPQYVTDSLEDVFYYMK